MIEWKCIFFTELTPQELYSIIRLRNEVFVAEQNCVFQDADNKDQQCFHLCGWDNHNLVAYARLIPEGVIYNEVSIGRVVTSPAYRNKGAGRALIEEAIEKCKLIFGKKNIKIGAQLYLKKFYESFGFRQRGEIYIEDGIEHIKMMLTIV